VGRAGECRDFRARGLLRRLSVRYGWYVGPNRSGTSFVVETLKKDLVAVDVEEHLAIAQFTRYVDPAPIFVRESAKSGNMDAAVLESFAAHNHWLLKVRHTATRTVCVHLGTLTHDAPKKPSCREALPAEVAVRGETRVPAFALSAVPADAARR
jgi:hypothetical protein